MRSPLTWKPNAAAHGPVSDAPNGAIINGHIFGNITMRTLITYPFQVPSRELHVALQDDLNINKQQVLVGRMLPYNGRARRHHGVDAAVRKSCPVTQYFTRVLPQHRSTDRVTHRCP
jgi:hypothetical protein